MTDDADHPAPAVRDGQTGPYGLRSAESPSDWKPIVQPGRTPTSSEVAFAHRCTRLRDRLERFERTLRKRTTGPGTEGGRFAETHIGIRDSFHDGLVRPGGSASLDALTRQVEDIERDFVIEHGIGRYRQRVQTTLILGVGITILMLILVFAAMLYWNSLMEWLVVDEELLNRITTDDTQTNFAAYAFVILGVLLGRIISLFMDYGKHIESFDAYDSAYRVIASPFLDASIDVLIGFVACLCFVTGAIVISIGSSADGAASELSTLKIRERWEIAMVFGLLIGLVRARFLSKLTSAAETGMG